MGGGGFQRFCVTNVPPVKNRGDPVVKQRTERNVLFPSKEFRDRVRSAAKERGFRSEHLHLDCLWKRTQTRRQYRGNS